MCCTSLQTRSHSYSQVLQQTVDYLMHTVLSDERKPFLEVWAFIRDRVRSVAQDLSIQVRSLNFLIAYTHRITHMQKLDSHPVAYSMLARCVRFCLVADQELCDNSHYEESLTWEVVSKLLISLLDLCAFLNNLPPSFIYTLFFPSLSTIASPELYFSLAFSASLS